MGNNLVGALCAAGRIHEARGIWETLGSVVPRLVSPKLPFSERHDIQGHCLDLPPGEATAAAWEGFIASSGVLPRLGPSWSFLQHGFLLSDLQYWSDD